VLTLSETKCDRPGRLLDLNWNRLLAILRGDHVPRAFFNFVGLRAKITENGADFARVLRQLSREINPSVVEKIGKPDREGHH